jgi:hypothetical protein
VLPAGLSLTPFQTACRINRGHDSDSQMLSIPVDDQEPRIEERFDRPISMGLSDHAAQSFAFLAILAVLAVLVIGVPLPLVGFRYCPLPATNRACRDGL